MSKKRKDKKAYLNDFKLDLNGGYRYQGEYRIFVGEEAEKQKRLGTLRIFSFAMAVVVIGSGLLEGAGITNSFYVILPYLVEVGGAGATIWAIVELLLAEKREHKIREYAYEKTIKKIPERAMILLVAAGLGLAGNVIYLFIHGAEGKLFPTLLYIAGRGLVVGLAFLIKKETKHLEYKKEILPEKVVAPENYD